MHDFNVNETIDITDVVYPVTFVKVKITLDDLENDFPNECPS